GRVVQHDHVTGVAGHLVGDIASLDALATRGLVTTLAHPVEDAETPNAAGHDGDQHTDEHRHPVSVSGASPGGEHQPSPFLVGSFFVLAALAVPEDETRSQRDHCGLSVSSD